MEINDIRIEIANLLLQNEETWNEWKESLFDSTNADKGKGVVITTCPKHNTPENMLNAPIMAYISIIITSNKKTIKNGVVAMENCVGYGHTDIEAAQNLLNEFAFNIEELQKCFTNRINLLNETCKIEKKMRELADKFNYK